MKRTPELLVPAGNMDSLKTAVRAGADAVYFGMGRLNARASAQNFDREGVREAIDECHAWGAKAHLTLNTLLLDREMQEALDTAAWLYECGADALIVQDMGLIALLRKQLADMPLHASTQMSILNGDGVKALEGLGFQRAVLGRECSLEDICAIATQTELEVFVHGAMCVSVSGQCLHSSMLGGRSGNRGGCAQPCRMEHRSQGEDGQRAEGYLLSMKDQCQLKNLPALAEIGVASLKIEGRMKSPDYVAAVVGSYRKALDLWAEGAEEAQYQAHCREAEAMLAAAFSRNGSFSTGYSASREGLIDERDPSYGRGVRVEGEGKEKMPLAMHFMVLPGRPAALSLQWNDFRVMVYGEIPQPAQKVALDRERIQASLCKLGDTPYACAHLDVMLEDGLFLSTSALNAQRRDGIAALTKKVAESFRRPARAPRIQFAQPHERQSASLPLIVAGVRNGEQGAAAIEAGVEGLILEMADWRLDAWQAWRDWLNGERSRRGKLPSIWLELPAVSLPHGAAVVRERLSLAIGQFDGLVLNNLGQLAWTKELDFLLRGGYPLNVVNTVSAVNYKKQGLESVLLSPELNAAQMMDVMRRVPGCGLLVYGKVATMQLRHCPLRGRKGQCGGCRSGLTYTDRKEERFLLRPTRFGADEKGAEDCVWQMYNSRPQDLARVPDKLRALPASEWRMQFVDESGEQVGERIEAYRKLRYGGAAAVLENSTSGHFKRGWS